MLFKNINRRMDIEFGDTCSACVVIEWIQLVPVLSA
jgi:hypothetical protein